MNTLKETIKKLGEAQKFLKNQRKTVNLVGERRMKPYQAEWKIQSNKYELRHLHAAYYELRKGKKLPVPKRKEFSEGYVEDLINKYKSEFEVKELNEISSSNPSSRMEGEPEQALGTDC